MPLMPPPSLLLFHPVSPTLTPSTKIRGWLVGGFLPLLRTSLVLRVLDHLSNRKTSSKKKKRSKKTTYLPSFACSFVKESCGRFDRLLRNLKGKKSSKRQALSDSQITTITVTRESTQTVGYHRNRKIYYILMFVTYKRRVVRLSSFIRIVVGVKLSTWYQGRVP